MLLDKQLMMEKKKLLITKRESLHASSHDRLYYPNLKQHHDR